MDIVGINEESTRELEVSADPCPQQPCSCVDLFGISLRLKSGGLASVMVFVHSLLSG